MGARVRRFSVILMSDNFLFCLIAIFGVILTHGDPTVCGVLCVGRDADCGMNCDDDPGILDDLSRKSF